MSAWTAPPRPAAYAEEALVEAILDGTYPPGSALPGERDLAAQLGVTRPTLREVLGRLERDGWLTVHQGKATRINDYWREGGLSVLEVLARSPRALPPDFVLHLLQVRLALAPAYAGDAVQHAAAQVVDCLQGADALADTPEAYAAFDWLLHHALTVASGNPIYTLILNGFAGLYQRMALLYFSQPGARAASQAFYQELLQAARRGDPAAARRIVRRVMKASIALWAAVQDAAGEAGETKTSPATKRHGRRRP